MAYPYDPTGSALDPSLMASESGGNWGAQNSVVGAGGLAGHYGRAQFGRARLQEAMDAGVIPQGTTPQQFMQSPELQKAAEDWHFGDIDNFIASKGLDKFVGREIGGVPVTMQGLRNAAHLGGKGGMAKFVESGGSYNPSDANGTSLLDYLRKGATSGDATGAARADIPAPGAAPTEGGTPGSGFNVPGQQPSLLDRINGAFGIKPEAGYGISDFLAQAAVSLMARDNPNGAAAFAKALGMGEKKKTVQPKMLNYDKETGRALFMNPTTGLPYEMQAGTGSGKELSEKARQTILDRDNNMSVVADNAEKAHYWRNKIVNGELDLGVMKQIEAGLAGKLNLTNEQQQLYTQYGQWVKNAANSALLLNKGVQTDKDYDRALQAIMPDSTRFDNGNALAALDTIYDRSRREYGSLRKAQDSTFKDYGKNAPSGDFVQTYNNVGTRLESLDKDEGYVGKRKAFNESRNKPSSTSTETTPRVGPAKGPNAADSYWDEIQKRRQANGGR
jgi:hypothetical protein